MLYASILCVFLPKPFNSLTLSPRKDDITLTNDNASVLEIAEKLGATTFLEYVHKTNLTKNFTQPGPLTVFIPSNQAFEEIPDEEKDLSVIKTLLLYHIIHGLHPKSTIKNEAKLKSEYKMEDKYLDVRMNIYHNGQIITASGSPIVNFDIKASNGIVHFLSRVMYLLPESGTLAQQAYTPITRYVAYGLMDGGLAEKLNKKEPYTLFAPTDLAFEQLPNKTMQILIGNKTAIRRLMENHIVSGTYFTKGMREKDKFTTLLGETIQVDSIKGNVTISGALLPLPDFTATNGVMHLTTKVFVPPDLF